MKDLWAGQSLAACRLAVFFSNMKQQTWLVLARAVDDFPVDMAPSR